MIVDLKTDKKYRTALIRMAKQMFNNKDDYDRYSYELIDWRIYNDLLDNENYVIYGEYSDKKLKGFAILNCTYGIVAYVYNVYVAPAYRKQGIGLKLKLKLEEEAKKMGYPIIATEVEIPNVESNRMNIKAGWTPKQHKRWVGYINYYKILC